MEWLVILSFVVTIVFWLWAILSFDKFEREPITTILYVFIIGGLISSFFAGIFNFSFAKLLNLSFEIGESKNADIGKSIWFFGFVGLNEEFFKVVTTVLLIRKSKKFNEPIDALIYSMTVAFGFSIFENIDYTAKLGLESFYFRQFTAVPLHVGLAAIWGMGIAKARFIKNGNYLSTITPYFLIAALVHFAYNFGVSWVQHPFISLVLAGSIAFFIVRFTLKKLKFYQKESPFSEMLFCHNCDTSNSAEARFCKNCGHQIELQFYNLCKNCNSRVSKFSHYCPSCGHSMS